VIAIVVEMVVVVVMEMVVVVVLLTQETATKLKVVKDSG
jgi:hypothetical protein